jgi:hypothetical protein
MMQLILVKKEELEDVARRKVGAEIMLKFRYLTSN